MKMIMTSNALIQQKNTDNKPSDKNTPFAFSHFLAHNSLTKARQSGVKVANKRHNKVVIRSLCTLAQSLKRVNMIHL